MVMQQVKSQCEINIKYTDELQKLKMEIQPLHNMNLKLQNNLRKFKE